MLQLVCNLSNVCRCTSWQKMVNHRGQRATSLGYFPRILSKIPSRGQIFLTYMTYICIPASPLSNQREILSVSWKNEGPKRYPNWGPNWGTPCFAPTRLYALFSSFIPHQQILTYFNTPPYYVQLPPLCTNLYFVLIRIRKSGIF